MGKGPRGLTFPLLFHRRMNHSLIPILADGGGSILFLVVFAIFGIIRYFASKKDVGEAPPTPASSGDPDEARRTREIQEEIRRRIAENMAKQAQGTTGVPPAAAPRPAISKPAAPAPAFHPEPVRAEARPQRAPAKGVDYMAKLAEARREEAESRQRIEETLRNLRSRSKAEAPAEPQTSAVFTDAESLLRSGQGLREAILLNEILARPLSERRVPSCPGLS